MHVFCDISAHLAFVSDMRLYPCALEEQEVAMAESRANREAVLRIQDSDFYKNVRLIRQALFSPDPPIGLLVNSHAKAYKIKDCATSVYAKKLPPGFLFRLWPPHLKDADSKAIYVTSPCEHFRRAASRLDTSQLLVLGSWLCGCYRPRSDLAEGFVLGPPLCSVSELMHHLEIHPSAWKRRLLRSVAECLIGNLASPSETALYLLLTCPSSFGGYGLPQPESNPVIRLDDFAKSLLPQQSVVRPDLFWPNAKLDLEYDSTEYHGEYINAHDRQRMAALRAMGIDVVPVAKQTLYSPRALRGIAEIVARKLGVPLQSPSSVRQAELRNTVLGPYNFW